MKNSRSEEAVSAVISIVLIIAVVVILGAVVGMVALGTIGGTQGNAKSVLVSANKGSSGIVFTVQGGMDLRSVTSLDLVSGSTLTNCTGSAPKVGQGCTVGTDSNGRTVMVAAFTDGSKQVVFDKNWGSIISGGNYGTASLTHVSGTTYRLIITRGPDADKVTSWTVYANLVAYGPYTVTYPGSIPDLDNTAVAGDTYTTFKIVLHINDGSDAVLVDQTVT
ncbi:type IV pilin [uncultured Methanoregula sp.]|uniref:type IV pilin n=1 Tax=uncultured Methanoregula sp. TaxID=1005933 RepID=UPI002AAB1D6B|nr:type IV pilin [uncultured Methanoregula sp.]